MSGRFGRAPLSGGGRRGPPRSSSPRRDFPPRGGDRQPNRPKRQYAGEPDQRPREAKRQHHEPEVIRLVANALALRTTPGTFGCLRVFNIAFDGPRPLGLTDQNFKQKILCHRTGPWNSIEFAKVLQMRCAEGAMLYVMDPNTAAKDLLESLDGSTIQLKTKDGNEEVWTLTIKESHTSGLRTFRNNPDVWLQFLSLLSDAALERGKFTLIGNASMRIVNTDPRTFRPLPRSRFGALAPGFAKALTACQDGLYWTFSPRYTLMLNRTMDEEIRDLSHKHQNPEDLATALRRRRLFVVTKYAPGNMYRVMDVSYEMKPTDCFTYREKQPDGSYVDKEKSHIDYLRERYAKDCPALKDDGLKNQPMVGCVLVGRRKQLIKVGRTVHIPASLLSVCCIDPRDLPKDVKEEITRMSQRKEREALDEIVKFVRSLGAPEIQEAYRSFGIQVGQELKELEGRVRRNAVQVISGESERSTMSLDDNGSFQQSFSRSSSHYRCPKIGDRYLILVKTDPRGRIDDGIIGLFLREMSQACRKWQWDFEVSNDPSRVPVVDWDGRASHLEERQEAIARRIRKNPAAKPIVLFALIPKKDESDYISIKKMAYQLELPSQVLTFDVLERQGGKAIFRILASMAAKLVPDGGARSKFELAVPWAVKNPLGSHQNVTVMGLSSYKPAYRPVEDDSRQSGHGGYGITLTTGNDCLGVVQDFGETHSMSRGGILGDIREHLRPLLHNLRFKHMRKIETIVVFRKGTSDGMMTDCADVEQQQIIKAYEDLMGFQRWNSHSKELLIANPLWKEKGTYIVEGRLMESGAPFRKEVKAEWGGSADGASKHVLLRLNFAEGEVPDISKSPVQCTGPDGRNTLLPKLPGMCFVMVNKSHNAHLAFFKKELLEKAQGRSGGRGGSRFGDTVPACTIVDGPFKGLSSTGLAREEFYIVPSTGVTGFSLPVHYSILHNNTHLSLKEIQDLSLRLTFLYYNQFNASKVPHVLRLAELGAERALTVYEGLAKEGSGLNSLQETHLFL